MRRKREQARRLLMAGAFTLAMLGAMAHDAGAATATGPSGTRPGPQREAFQELIALTAADEGVDADLVHAIISAESRYDPLAISRRGAKGLMQLMPDTAARYAVRNPFDPRANVRGGIRYLRDLQTLFPRDLARMLAAYNAGENAVLRYQGVPPYRQTQEYVARVLALYTRRSTETVPVARTEGKRPQVPAPTPVVYRLEDDELCVTYTNIAPIQVR